MSQRRINLLMVLLSLTGGIIGYLVGEYLLFRLSTDLPHWLLMGLYFGQFAFFVGLFCLIAELISPRLNGMGWKQRYTGFSWKMLVPSTFLMAGIAAMLLQFLYGADFAKTERTDNLVMLLDISDSMKQTDPDGQLFRAAADVIEKMEPDMRIAVITFNEHTEILQPLIQVQDQSVKDEVVGKMRAHQGPHGRTNIEEALKAAYRHLQETGNASPNSTVLLMSDGYSNVDTERALASYKDARISVNTVGMQTNVTEGVDLLKRIASETNGRYYNVENADQLTGVFGQIYELSRQDRHLMGERNGYEADSAFRSVLRVASLLVIGALLGLALGMIFDNHFLAKSFSIGGAVAGLLAGLLVEAGFGSGELPGFLLRLGADAIMAVVLTLFTAIIPIHPETAASDQHRFSRGRYTSAKLFDRKAPSGNRFDS